MKTLTFIAEATKSTVLVPPSTTAAAHEGYVDITPGTMGVNLRAVVAMGNAANLLLELKSADDAIGTNAVAFAVDVPLFVDGVRQTDGKSHEIIDPTGNFIVDFCVDPGLIPDGKFVGIATGASNAATLVATTAIENSATKPSA